VINGGRVDNLAGATWEFLGEADIIGSFGATPGTFANAGGVVKSGAGETRVAAAFDNAGTVELRQGAFTTPSGSSLQFDGLSWFGTHVGTEFGPVSSLTGATTNADLFDPAGTVTFVGGSAASPRLLEVMGQDRGIDPAGYDRNFAYGTLSLNSAYVELLDLADNAAGTGQEALYVDTLIVSAGSTLDLNGLKVYARASQLDGSVLDGSVLPVQDGGELLLDTSVSGSIASPGEVDEWTFFGRSGRAVTLFANPGDIGSPLPISPTVGHIRVEILDPTGIVLASGVSGMSGETVELTGTELPGDGTYRIRVSAPPALPDLTGNYLLSVYNASVDVRPLVFNQREIGVVESPYSIDRWAFAGSADQLVQFDLISSNTAGLKFSLTGPNGWAGLVDQATDSVPFTLPADGMYVLEAVTNGEGTGAYAFRLDGISVTDITLGTPASDTLPGLGSARLFRVDLPTGGPLSVHFDDVDDVGQAEVYLKLGVPPTQHEFDYRSEQSGIDQEITVPFAAPGNWYVLVYGGEPTGPSAFTLQADTESVILDAVTPDLGGIGETATMTLSGAGFVPGTGVELIDNGAVYSAQSVTRIDWTRLSASFDLGQAPEGVYDVRVTVPGGASSTLPEAFQVEPAGGAVLETRIILPSVLGRHALATLYVEYGNTGTATMPAPILTLQSADPDGSDRPLQTLAGSSKGLTTGFWTSAVPDGFDTSVQIYASGESPGLLLPGETVRVPVYYAGLLQPWDFSDDQVEFEIRIRNAEDPELINWASRKATLRPAWIPPEVWDPIYSNLVAQIGPTWGDYIAMLSRNATHLAQVGLNVNDVSELYGFELQQAYGLTAVPTLEAVTDASLPTPGLSLALGRTFGNTIPDRYHVGPFGRGWTASWQIELGLEDDGTVVVREGGNSQRRFQPDSRYVGAYFSQAGDTGTLRQLGDGTFELTEANGLVTRFAADGTLSSVEDVEGNRITATFTDGQLTALTHSSGASLTIDYNPAGLIERLTDSYGRVTTYGYDATNTHLLSVTGPAGTTTYTYSVGAGPAREHALTSISVQGGATRTFEYDNRGRLQATYTTGDAERIDYTYDDTGTITVTDASGNEASLFLDHRGLVVRYEDGTGDYILYEYNDSYQLIRQTDSLGRSQTYTWCGCGQLESVTDELGNTVTFALTSTTLASGTTRNLPTSFTNANGNVTTYYYDADGNVIATTYADGIVERVGYDAQGNPTTLTNRSGQAIRLTYNTAGQVTLEEYPDGATDYTYDTRGRLSIVNDDSGVTTFTYDDADRLTRVEYPTGRGLSYGYDGAGRRTRLEDSSGFVVRYGYDAAGRLETLRDSADPLIVRYTYDAAGRLQREDKGNGTYTTYTYDAAGRVDIIAHHAPDNSLNARFDYIYDPVGQRTGVATLNGTWVYTYDLTRQLIHAVFTSTNPAIPDQDLSYEYDASGNRIRTVVNGGEDIYAPNNMNQYTAAGNSTYRYDRDGNLREETNAAGTTYYAYNARGRLVGVVGPQGAWQYEYDSFGNRTAVVANGVRTEYLLDPTGLVDVIAEFDAAGNRLASYAHGLGLEAAIGTSGWGYYDFDALGSTAGVSGVAGRLVNQYAYGPFGGSLLSNETVANPFEFIGAAGVMTGGEGLHYMRARYYDANTGRFTSEDPMGFQGGDANFYTYGLNSPLSAVDPQGTFPVLAGSGAILGSAIGIVSYAVIQGLTGGTITAGGLLGAGVSGGLYGGILGATGALAFLGRVGGPAAMAGVGGITNAIGYLTMTGIDGGFNFGGLGASLVSGVLTGWFPTKMIGFKGAKWGAGSPSSWKNLLLAKNAHGKSIWKALGAGGVAHTFVDIVIATAFDPNEKFGAAGFGPQEFIMPEAVIPYQVNFENLGPGSIPAPAQPATAPAQRVVVTDQLSPNLDWSTLEFTSTGFGDYHVSVPEGRQYHFSTVSVNADGKTFDVEVELSFATTTGTVRATFQTIDPGTSLPPDVLTGFLPPEDGTGICKGYIGFTVQPKASLPTGTEIRNVALISFDGQTNIATNQIDPQDPAAGTSPDREALSTIDAAGPRSQVEALPATSLPDFVVRWAGADDIGGSGVRSFDVYVSTDGDPFALWLDDTTATTAVYTGAVGHTYAFYTVATDNVGHVEAVPAAADTITTVVSPLEVEAGGDQSPAEGDLVGLPGASFTYSGEIGSLSGTVNWGDGTSEDVELIPGEGGGTFANTHVYADDGTYTVTVILTDADGDASDTAAVTVTNVAPQDVDAGADLTVDEGATVHLSGTFTDPGAVDTHTQTWSVSASNGQVIDDGVGASFTFVPNNNGTYTVTYTVTDDDGGTASDQAIVTVNNVAPSVTVNAVSVTVGEGARATNSGTFGDPGADTVTLAASVGTVTDNGNGTWSWSFVTSDGPDQSQTVTITATDSDGAESSTTFGLTVNNLAPVITSVATSAPQDNRAAVGEIVTVSGVFTDAGTLDTHRVIIAWNDGTVSDSDADPGDFTSFDGDGGGSGSFVANHTYGVEGGIYEISVTLIDDDTGAASTSILAWVVGTRVKDGDLQIVGSSADDTVTINELGNGSFKVHADFLHSGTFRTFSVADVNMFVAYLGAGDDHLNIAGDIMIPAIIHGEAGNDYLAAGGGPSVLLGGEGNDRLNGGPGTGILVGGSGLDELIGGSGGDVLIGGRLDRSDDDDFLAELLGAWILGDPYEDRIAALDALLSVTDDGDEDDLSGGSGRDLFWVGTGDVDDHDSNETVY
jgi:RHS repeat-associated protein